MSYSFRLKAHSARRSEVTLAQTKSTHNDVPSVRKIKVLEENELVLSYRFPWSAVPRGRAWAGLQVALLHVGRLVQDIAVVVV